jgi:hypothetical protein
MGLFAFPPLSRFWANQEPFRSDLAGFSRLIFAPGFQPAGDFGPFVPVQPASAGLLAPALALIWR